MYTIYDGYCCKAKRYWKEQRVKYPKHNTYDFFLTAMHHFFVTKLMAQYPAAPFMQDSVQTFYPFCLKTPDMPQELAEMLRMESSAYQRAWVGEGMHYFKYHRVFCVSDTLSEWLLQTDVDVAFDDVELPAPAVEVCFDTSFVQRHLTSPSGCRLNAVLVFKLNGQEDLPGKLHRDITWSLFGKEQLKMLEEHNAPIFKAMMEYNLPGTQTWGALLSFEFPGNRFGRACLELQNLKTDFKLSDALNDLAERDLMLSSNAQDFDMSPEMRLLGYRLAISALLYAQTENADITNGELFGRLRTEEAPPRVSVLGASLRDGPPKAYHTRVAHIRKLSADRYYKGIPENERTVRYVFVRECEINPHLKQITPLHEQQEKEPIVKVIDKKDK